MNHKFKIVIKKNLWKYLCSLGHTLGFVGILNLLYNAYGHDMHFYLGFGCLVLLTISHGYELYRINNADYFRKKEEKENINADT